MKRALIVLALAASTVGCAAPASRVGVASEGRLGAGDSLGLNLQRTDNDARSRQQEMFAIYPQE